MSRVYESYGKFSVGYVAVVKNGVKSGRAYWTDGREFTISKITKNLGSLFLHQKDGKNCYLQECKLKIADTKINRKLYPDYIEHEEGWILV